jgi:hypothetical protein
LNGRLIGAYRSAESGPSGVFGRKTSGQNSPVCEPTVTRLPPQLEDIYLVEFSWRNLGWLQRGTGHGTRNGTSQRHPSITLLNRSPCPAYCPRRAPHWR